MNNGDRNSPLIHVSPSISGLGDIKGSCSSGFVSCQVTNRLDLRSRNQISYKPLAAGAPALIVDRRKGRRTGHRPPARLAVRLVASGLVTVILGTVKTREH